MKRKSCILIPGLCALAAGLCAQEPSPARLSLGAAAGALPGEQALGPRQPLKLTLKRAVEMALSPEGNARTQIGRETVVQARARQMQAFGAMLPDLESALTKSNYTRALETLGLNSIQSPLLTYIQLPRLLGPTNLLDARLSAVSSLFDMSLIQRYRASRSNSKAAAGDSQFTDDQVAAQVARAYVAAQRADAVVEAAQANFALAEAVRKTAESQRAAGAGLAIEVTRAGVELANQRQQLLAAKNDRRKAQLQLLRVMNQSLEQQVELVDTLHFVPVDQAWIRDAHADALKFRKDLQAQALREDAARKSHSATRFERLPSAAGYSNWGATGTGFNRAIPTYEYGIQVRVPVFDGGRRDARRIETLSVVRQENIRSGDMREQIDLDVKVARDNLASAAEQVQVAEEGLTLSEKEFAQAKRRYENGIANSLEVTDAGTRLERARNNRISAIYAYQQARIDLGVSTGLIRRYLD